MLGCVGLLGCDGVMALWGLFCVGCCVRLFCGVLFCGVVLRCAVKRARYYAWRVM